MSRSVVYCRNSLTDLYELLVCGEWTRGSLVVNAQGYKPKGRGLEIL
jgi:hypothetical protein